MTVPESPPLQPPKKKASPVGLVFGFLFWVVVPLALGWLLSGYALPRPAVGLIRLTYDIYPFTANYISQQIDEARLDPRIKAVVVQLDSPGGEVSATQTIFFDLQKLRREMPVACSIDSIAASGAYYSAMACDPVYAKPSSTVGNVGVWGYFPSSIGVNDTILASGPFKLTASNEAEFLREIEGIKQEFLATVVSQRGERLQIAPADLSQGLAYPGREAQRLGLIDSLGSQSDALDKAAEMAGIVDFEVIDLEARVIEKFYGGQNPYYYYESWVGRADPVTKERILPPGIYLLYDVRLRRTP
jgi:protease-4